MSAALSPIAAAAAATALPGPLSLAFDWVIDVSWQASLVAAVVLVVQALLGRRVSARWRCNLWLLVVARLLLPVVPESRWSFCAAARLSCAWPARPRC